MECESPAGSRDDKPHTSETHDDLETKACASAKKTFYRWQCISSLLYLLIMRARMGGYFHLYGTGTVCTRPSWMPARWLLLLHRARLPVLAGMPTCLAIAAIRTDCRLTRLLTAVVSSMYHLLESSVTTRHGEYPFLYNAWAMLLPDAYAHAASLGIAIHFVLSSGIAKLQVGGRSWLGADTMRSYLDCYRASRSNPPSSKSLNWWVSQRAWATRSISFATIALECFLIPGTLLMPPVWRNIGSACMVAMHLGIALIMSTQVGMVFLASIPSYLVGFNCRARLGSRPWYVAVLVALAPSAFAALRRRPLSESWPMTPIALFMWSGKQANVLIRTLMTGDTRFVLSTREAPMDLTNLQIRYNGIADNAFLRGRSVVHDSLTRVIGFTMAQGNLVEAVRLISQGPDGAWDMRPFLQTLQSWLMGHQRLIEMHSGLPLVRASFVRADARGRISEVLMDGLTSIDGMPA